MGTDGIAPPSGTGQCENRTTKNRREENIRIQHPSWEEEEEGAIEIGCDMILSFIRSVRLFDCSLFVFVISYLE